MARRQRTSAATRVAATLREEVLAAVRSEPEGFEFFLGAEDKVADRLEVSIPTLRQAVRVLEVEHLLEVRPGPNGGIYGHSPSAKGVTQTTSVFLRAQRTTSSDITTAQALITPEVARHAAQHPVAAERAILLQIAHEMETELKLCRSDEDLQRAYSPLRVKYQREMAMLCDNRLLRLFQLTLVDILEIELFELRLGLEFFTGRGGRLYVTLAEQISAGDSDAAYRTSHGGTLHFQNWVAESNAGAQRRIPAG